MLRKQYYTRHLCLQHSYSRAIKYKSSSNVCGILFSPCSLRTFAPVERIWDATQLYSSKVVTIYTQDVLRDKEINPIISLGVNYTRLEITGIVIQICHVHNVGKLLGGRYMKNTKLTQLYLLADEVNIKFNMLSALVLHWVGHEIGGRNIITVNHRGFWDGDPKFTK